MRRAMGRILNFIFLANLLVAISFVVGFAVYELKHGMPIDQYLGSGPVQVSRHPTQYVVPWKYDIGVECVALLGLGANWIARKNPGYDKLVCGVIGLVMLSRLGFTKLMSDAYTDEDIHVLHITSSEFWLALYVWSAHLLYGLGILNRLFIAETEKPMAPAAPDRNNADLSARSN
jgi:hypothetical protein